jgi:hypothetical protein
MSFGIGSKITRKPQEDFFKALELADVRPLPGSEFEDANLKKYIFEPVNPSKKYTHQNVNTLLSTIEEGDENIFSSVNAQQGGNSSDTDLFIGVFIAHGQYPVNNIRSPVVSISGRTAPVIVPGNKFDGYKTFTICSAAPPSQVNMGIGNLIASPYHNIIVSNIERFAVLLTEKVSLENESNQETESEKPVLIKPATNPAPRYSSSSLTSSTSRQSTKKKYKLPSHSLSTGVFTPSKVSGLSGRLSGLPGIIKSVSHRIKSNLVSLVRGCINIIMNFNIDYAVLNLSDNRYNIIQKQVVNAIICMGRIGTLKINSDFFEAFSYSLYKGLRSHDQLYFYELTRTCLIDSIPGTNDYDIRRYAVENSYERFPSIRVLVREGAYQPRHVEKEFLYHPVIDAHLFFGLRIYKVSMKTQNKKGETSVVSKIDFFDIPIGEAFDGKPRRSDGYSITTLSDLSLFISSKIDEHYYHGRPVRKILSLFDFSCSAFNIPQSQIPKTTGREWWGIGKNRPKMGGGGGNKTRRRSRRKERKERNNSKIRNRIKRTRRSNRTRKNRKIE